MGKVDFCLSCNINIAGTPICPFCKLPLGSVTRADVLASAGTRPPISDAAIQPDAPTAGREYFFNRRIERVKPEDFSTQTHSPSARAS